MSKQDKNNNKYKNYSREELIDRLETLEKITKIFGVDDLIK